MAKAPISRSILSVVKVTGEALSAVSAHGRLVHLGYSAGVTLTLNSLDFVAKASSLPVDHHPCDDALHRFHGRPPRINVVRDLFASP